MLVKFTGYKSLIRDLNFCVAEVSKLKLECCIEVTQSLIKTLVVAEDHRNALHFGVDPIAIIRALKIRLVNGVKQGASTVEQQLVRTLTQRYEKTPRRKVREQILAVMLGQHFTKDELCSAYLSVAFYGSSMAGCIGIQKIKRAKPDSTDASIVAYLKYPKSLTGSCERAAKHAKRVNHINHLLNGDIELFLLGRPANSELSGKIPNPTAEAGLHLKECPHNRSQK